MVLWMYLNMWVLVRENLMEYGMMEFDWSREEDAKVLGYVLYDLLTKLAAKMTHEEWLELTSDIIMVNSRTISETTNISKSNVELILCELESKELIKAS